VAIFFQTIITVCMYATCSCIVIHDYMSKEMLCIV